jgi:hypothetical protein
MGVVPPVGDGPGVDDQSALPVELDQPVADLEPRTLSPEELPIARGYGDDRSGRHFPSRKWVDHRNVVRANPRVGGDQGESTVPRLRDEQPIERIAVMQRQACDGEPIVW